MSLISLQDVSFAYNGSFRLEDINLEINKGDFTGIIGGNGSGKSTIIKLMAGWLNPLGGKVCLDGQPMAKLPRKEVAKKIAVVSQGLRTDFEFTVEEMVRLGRLPHLGRWQSEGPGDAQAIARAMELTRTTKFRNRSITKLSGGEAQRVLVAQALAQQPEVLLLDEPTTYMDMAFQQELFNLMADLNSEGITVVSVLHDINMAALYCKKLVAVKTGRIITEGEPQDVVTSENIQTIFGLKVDVNPHPLADRPQVIMLPGDPKWVM